MKGRYEHDKKPKRAVDYSVGMEGRRCGLCEYYIVHARRCELVKGPIHPDYWCRLFKRKAQEDKK